MTAAPITPRHAGSPWSGVLLLVVAGMIVGLGPAGVLIGLAVAGMAVERTAPHVVDKVIDLLSS